MSQEGHSRRLIAMNLLVVLFTTAITYLSVTLGTSISIAAHYSERLTYTRLGDEEFAGLKAHFERLFAILSCIFVAVFSVLWR